MNLNLGVNYESGLMSIICIVQKQSVWKDEFTADTSEREKMIWGLINIVLNLSLSVQGVLVDRCAKRQVLYS